MKVHNANRSRPLVAIFFMDHYNFSSFLVDAVHSIPAICVAVYLIVGNYDQEISHYNPWHHQEEPQKTNSHKTSGRLLKYNNHVGYIWSLFCDIVLVFLLVQQSSRCISGVWMFSLFVCVRLS